jgi:hypothetical protein
MRAESSHSLPCLDSFILLSPGRGRGWERGLRMSCAIGPGRDAVRREVWIGTVNRVERRTLTPPLPLAGERSMKGERP